MVIVSSFYNWNFGEKMCDTNCKELSIKKSEKSLLKGLLEMNIPSLPPLHHVRGSAFEWRSDRDVQRGDSGTWRTVWACGGAEFVYIRARFGPLRHLLHLSSWKCPFCKMFGLRTMENVALLLIVFYFEWNKGIHTRKVGRIAAKEGTGLKRRQKERIGEGKWSLLPKVTSVRKMGSYKIWLGASLLVYGLNSLYSQKINFPN